MVAPYLELILLLGCTNLDIHNSVSTCEYHYAVVTISTWLCFRTHFIIIAYIHRICEYNTSIMHNRTQGNENTNNNNTIIHSNSHYMNLN